jgi:hypothetical protein
LETDAFKGHYHQLREYLTDYLVQIGYSHRGRSSAKEKLSRLPAEEFVKVSTDVHDEIMRRMYDAREGVLFASSMALSF